MQSETLSSTENKKIFVEEQQAISDSDIQAWLDTMARALSAEEPPEALIALLRGIIPTYHSPEEVNGAAIARAAETVTA